MIRAHMPAEKAVLAKRNAALDALRGIAALLVVFNHLQVPWASFSLGDIGRIGVLLFFIISGYCIFLAVNKYRQERLVNFLVKRFFRLYPAYWVSILGAVVVFGGQYDPATVFYNLTMVQYLFSVPDILGVYWTLFVEIVFYGAVIVLIVFNLVSRRDIVLRLFYGFIILTILAAGVRYGTSWDLPFAHALFMTTFLFGGVMYFNAQTRQPLPNTLTHAAAFLMGVLVVSWLVYNDPTTGIGEVDTYDTLSYFGCYLIATILFIVGTLYLRIETRITSYLGAISYSIYLFHIIVSEIFSPFISLPFVSSTILYLALIIVVSAFVHHVVEQPFISLGGYLVKQWNARKSTPVSASP